MKEERRKKQNLYIFVFVHTMELTGNGGHLDCERSLRGGAGRIARIPESGETSRWSILKAYREVEKVAAPRLPRMSSRVSFEVCT